MGMNVLRSGQNPLLRPQDVKPSRADFKVDGVFNCGVTKFEDEYILLCRVAESAAEANEQYVSVPIVVSQNGKEAFDVIRYDRSQYPDLDFDDPRTIRRMAGDKKVTVNLTSLSHLRVARSEDGIHFSIDEKPTIMPNSTYESWGIEDPRITKIEETYYINYTAVSKDGAATALITTTDFVSYQRHGIIFLPENKDVAIFPEKINGQYYAMNRPVPNAFGNPDIWLSQSPDLLHWGGHIHLSGVAADGWENGRTGGGAVPFRVKEGWMVIYHAADARDRYCLGAMILDADNPEVIVAKSQAPLLEPEEIYELEGFFGNVVFTCGCIYEEEIVKIFYGASDECICRVDISLDDIYEHLSLKRK